MAKTINEVTQYDPFPRVPSIITDEQLIMRLSLFVGAAESRVYAASSPLDVNFVDVNDARISLTSLLDEITNASGAQTTDHFHELGTSHGGRGGDGEGGNSA